MTFLELCELFLMTLYNLCLVAGVIASYEYTESFWVMLLIIFLVMITHPYLNNKNNDKAQAETEEI